MLLKFLLTTGLEEMYTHTKKKCREEAGKLVQEISFDQKDLPEGKTRFGQVHQV